MNLEVVKSKCVELQGLQTVFFIFPSSSICDEFRGDEISICSVRPENVVSQKILHQVIVLELKNMKNTVFGLSLLYT